MSELVVRTSRPPAPAHGGYFSPLAIATTVVRHHELIRGFAARDILERHKGAVLGAAWNVISPLLTLAIYTAIFGYLFGTRWNKGSLPGPLDFPLVYLAGYTMFQVFVECANRAPTMVSSKSNLVRKVVFPLEILPITALLASLFHAAIVVGIVLIVLICAVGPDGMPKTAVFFPLMFVPLIMLSMGVSWALSAVGVFVRDLRHIVVVITQLLQFATPLFYKLDTFEQDPNKHWLVTLIKLNPLTPIVENTRRVLLWNEMPDWKTLGWVTLGSAVVMQIGYAVFMGMRRSMADVH